MQGANQTSGVSDSDIVGAFERFIDAGNSTLDLFTAISELLEESGFFGSKKTEKEATNGVSLDSEPVEEDSIL
ncbi:prophage protein [Lactococcus lactis subsp. lactis]|uniref:Prophage protein n=1 Tax=Lactococcus lactis subsp. lactis TaxID=1360 RepID=A0A0V8CZ70_LACLL|nr:prophage protein [Lactococcus lactis subsp. lactis]